MAREAESCEREARLNPLVAAPDCHLQKIFGDLTGPIVAVSDYQKSLAGSIAKWMPASYTALGTDGFGVSGTRPELRDYFEVSANHIVQTVLVALFRQGLIDAKTLTLQLTPLGIKHNKPDPAAR